MKIVGIPKCVPLVLPSQRDSLLPFSSSRALSSKTKIERNKSYPLQINIIYFYHKISIFLNCAHKFFKQMRDLHSENRKIKRKERVTDWIKTNSVPPHPSFSLQCETGKWLDWILHVQISKQCGKNVYCQSTWQKSSFDKLKFFFDCRFTYLNIFYFCLMMFRKYAFFYFLPPNKILNQVHTVHLINGVIINEIIINLLREQSSCRHLMPPVAFKLNIITACTN